MGTVLKIEAGHFQKIRSHFLPWSLGVGTATLEEEKRILLNNFAAAEKADKYFTQWHICRLVVRLDKCRARKQASVK